MFLFLLGKSLTIKNISSGLHLCRYSAQSSHGAIALYVQRACGCESYSSEKDPAHPTEDTDSVAITSLHTLNVANKKRKQVPYCPVLFQNQAEETSVSVTLPSCHQSEQDPSRNWNRLCPAAPANWQCAAGLTHALHPFPSPALPLLTSCSTVLP